MLDPFRLADADKTKTLAIKAGPAFTCAICGASQEPHTWYVTLSAGLGKACTGCAADAGWSVN